MFFFTEGRWSPDSPSGFRNDKVVQHAAPVIPDRAQCDPDAIFPLNPA